MTSAGKRKPRNARASVMSNVLGSGVGGSAAPTRSRATAQRNGSRCSAAGRAARAADASGSEPRPPARHGQNDPVMALGRKNSLFAGSDGGAHHWAIVASLVATAKLNGVEPQAWLTDVLERMVSGRIKAHELERLLPWAWKAEQLAAAVDA